ncbi:hypothetical protein [Pantoea]|uniref:Phage protein n=1 Tax=Pantoea stewartii TaxID=66269 RepID=A0AB34VKA9_9GAMM|nr:hypothetical protein [Pantoea]KTS74258.1 hypothetical protein RSA30_06385 [Pantoea stewartii]KTT00963.1 hypothetical protein RSA13_00630 [Pantoea stewartii]KTT08480.1 hypothetical protein RSA36_05675 [Pantoea stewartii]TDL54711.1 hypothetical protein E2R52_12060 [Pantoea ananatis]
MAKKPFSFAHLVGLNRSAAARAAEEHDDDDEEKKGKKARSRRAEEQDDDDNRDPDADDDSDDPDAEDDDNKDPDAEEDDDKKRDPDASEGDDDDGDDDEKRDGRKARTAERQRCARIFNSSYAAANPALAASLAFNTGMSSADAIRVMKSSGSAAAAPEPRRASLDDRMRSAGNVRLGPDGQKTTATRASAVVEKMTGLYNSARGNK